MNRFQKSDQKSKLFEKKKKRKKKRLTEDTKTETYKYNNTDKQETNTQSQLNFHNSSTITLRTMTSTIGCGQQLKCKYHPDAYLAEDYRAGDLICTACGLIVGDRVIDVQAEWRTSTANDITDKHRSNSSSDSSTPAMQRKESDTSMLTFACHEITAMADRLIFPQSPVDQA